MTIGAIELGESPPEDEPSPLQDLPSHDYFWIVTQFLELLCTQPYRERLLPFLLRELPVEGFAPSNVQSALLLLHYLLAYWPVPFWNMLERLQSATASHARRTGISPAMGRSRLLLRFFEDCW